MKRPSQKRRRLLAGASAAIALGPLHARAQAFPSKNIRVVIPTAQGGGSRSFSG
jgi:tripartite-type tricarboxylate transporter receptor subunit TctC